MKKNLFFKNLCLISRTKFFEGGDVIATPVLFYLIIVSGLRCRLFCHCIIVVVVLYFLIWSYRMCWAGWLGWKPSVAVQIFGPSLERAVVFGPSLDPGSGRSNERLRLALDLRVVFLGSSESFFARAR